MTAKKSIEAAMLPGVQAGELAGAAALVWRNGSVLQSAAVGRRDLVSGLPVEFADVMTTLPLSVPTG